MVKFILEDSDEALTTHSGLGLIGLLLSKTNFHKRFSSLKIPEIKSSPDIVNGDVTTSYVGLLCQSKNDFDHIEPFRDDPFFYRALGIQSVPSSATLRQRLDQIAKVNGWKSIILEESAKLINQFDSPVTPISTSDDKAYVPLDIDVSPFDNSKTKKEGVSRTYKGCDGYSPNFGYLGQEGYVVNVELREGSTHVQKDTDKFLEKCISYARTITNLPILVRMDGGNDSVENLKVCVNEENVNFIIKRNPRREKPENWLMVAEQFGKCIQEREGKRVFYGAVEVTPKKMKKPIRQVYKVVERTIDKNGQILLIPDIEFESYWTLLPLEPEEVINLYHEHGTCEQFHSELKTDLDLERFPSGKFATNDFILHLGCLAYNILRIIGQESLKIPDAPLKRKVFRRRVKTVIQNLITLASKMVKHSRQIYLKFGSHSPWFPTFKRLYNSFST